MNSPLKEDEKNNSKKKPIFQFHIQFFAKNETLKKDDL